MKKFIVKIGKLWSGVEGATEQDEFNVDLEFDSKEIAIKAPIKGEILLVKLKNEVIVVLTNVESKVERICEKCLSAYESELFIPSVERSFYVQWPKDDPDYNPGFLISVKDLTIDLYEMIRQEIILHFQLISVCSKSCKGLCKHCGVNLNNESCSCKDSDEDVETQKPFKNLKNLIK